MPIEDKLTEPVRQAPHKDASVVRLPVKGRTAAALKTKQFPPIIEIVEGYLVEGLTLLAGRPKIGKSWLALDIALAVADGGACLGDIFCKQGDALYIALEDNERRLRSRISKILGESGEWPQRFEYEIEYPRANEGGIDKIREWIKAKSAPRLVVIDVLEAFRSRAKRGAENPYAADYETIKTLQTISLEFKIAILVVHHLRKGASDWDPQDKISGTLGQTGAADTFLILDRHPAGITLFGKGRDIEEIDRAVRFNCDSCRWEVLGDADGVRRSAERNAIIAILKEAEKPLGPASIAKEAGLKEVNVRQVLRKMILDGEIRKAGYGKYAG